MQPLDTTDAVENYSGFNARDAISAKMTAAQIRKYFTSNNFREMFSGDDDISNWPCTYSDMAEYAINWVNKEKKNLAK